MATETHRFVAGWSHDRRRWIAIAVPYALIVGGLAATAVITRDPWYWLPTVAVSLPFGLVAFPMLYVVYGLGEQVASAAGVSDFAHGIEPDWFRTIWSVAAVLIFMGAAVGNVMLLRALCARHASNRDRRILAHAGGAAAGRGRAQP